MPTMKAAVFDGQGGIAVQEVPRPELAGDYDILCRLEWGATCTGTDNHIRLGRFPFSRDYPTVAGHESVGRVTATGGKVRYFREGDLVTRVGCPALEGLRSTWGGYAEWGLARDQQAMVADGQPPWTDWSARVHRTVPYGLDPRAAPMFTTWRETASCWRRLAPPPAARALVLGSGGNGFSFAAVAKASGAKTVAMTGAQRMKAAAARAGVDVFLPYYDVAKSPEMLKEHGPFDVIIDAVGKAGALDAALPYAAPGARVTVYGIDDLGCLSVNPAGAPGGCALLPASYDEAEAHGEVSDWARMGLLDASAWYDPGKPVELPGLLQAFICQKSGGFPKILVKLS